VRGAKRARTSHCSSGSIGAESADVESGGVAVGGAAVAAVGGYRCDAASPHALAKDRANDIFVCALLSTIAGDDFANYCRLGYLDAFTHEEGFDLRTTDRLLAITPSTTSSSSPSLYSANRDAGVVRALRSKGVQAYEGEWRDAVQLWRNQGLRFRGFFLDFCNGSAEFLLGEVRRVEPLLDRPAVVAWTLPARDFGASPFSLRITQMTTELQRMGWRLAGGDVLSSCLEYASSGHQRVAMQCWCLPR
jgi:hypothetical protein